MERIRFQTDEHLDHAIAAHLNRSRIDTITARDAGLLGASDRKHLAHAFRERRVMVTRDHHFLDLHWSGFPHAGIVYCSSRVVGIGAIIHGLIVIHNLLSPDEMMDHLEIL